MTKDMMPKFDLFQPADVDTALKLADKYKDKAWIMAGGQDSLDWFKDRAKRPEAVIDLGGIEALKGIRETAAGIEIGALTTLAEIAANPMIKEKFGLLATAAGRVASPQIRTVGTIGGNVSQDARCWYYRSGMDCYRAGGNTCFAGTPQGMNREHCLFGASRCVAVTPSDTAPVMVTLEAEFVIRSSKGERVVPAEQFFIGPAVNITHMTALQAGDILTAIRIPSKWAGAKFYFEKVADRNTWDFPLVNVASAMKVKADGVIEDIRIVCGAVECVPRRLNAVEDIVKGSAQNEETATLAASSAARGAAPLNFNHFKIPLMENLVKRAIRDS
ncbi:MAG: xanthine dehydrogenase family protein subunit M [Rhodospirillaceae bacterium]|nr:xanthine dehydrogenase family protein subunit M [Rhodospirillaceae bacterium]